MPTGGELWTATQNVDLADHHAAADGRLIEPDAYLTLSVSDTGIGMDSITLARIFEPFFTTKPEGQGTGLGLATVHGIVDQIGGAITVDTAPGRGTTMRVYLPTTTAACPLLPQRRRRST